MHDAGHLMFCVYFVHFKIFIRLRIHITYLSKNSYTPEKKILEIVSKKTFSLFKTHLAELQIFSAHFLF